MGSVAMEKEYESYKYPVTAFRDIEELKRKISLNVAKLYTDYLMKEKMMELLLPMPQKQFMQSIALMNHQMQQKNKFVNLLKPGLKMHQYLVIILPGEILLAQFGQ